MAISAISFGTSSYSSSIDAEYELIKQRLRALGLVSTGNKAADKLLLEKVEKNQQNSGDSIQAKNSVQNKREKPPAPIEWQNLMAEAGVSLTGDLYTDYEKAVSVIKSKIDSAKDDSEKNKYSDLLSSIDSFVANHKSSTVTLPEEMVGASAVADLNKLMLMKKS